MKKRIVKFANLGLDSTHEKLNNEILHRIDGLIKHGSFINGPEVEEFEQKFAEYCGAQYCCATSSGSSALSMSVKKLDVEIVIIPALSFAATSFSLLEADPNIKIIYCDVDKHGLLDQGKCLQIIEELRYRGHYGKITIVPVYLYGQYFHMNNIITDLTIQSDDITPYIIEDACQAHGVVNLVQGDVACFSFYPSKNIGAFGDAGAIVTNSWDIYRTVKMLSNYGDYVEQKYTHAILGGNHRMDTLQALVLLEKLRVYPEDMKHIKKIAKYYRGIGIKSFVMDGNNSYHLYPILSDNPERLCDIFAEHCIEVGRHYPYILPDLHIEHMSFGAQFPIARSISQRCVTLPIGPHITVDDVDYVYAVLTNNAVLTEGNVWRVLTC